MSTAKGEEKGTKTRAPYKKSEPRFCVSAAPGWRAVFLNAQRKIETFPIAYFRVNTDDSTEAVILDEDNFAFVRAGEPRPVSEKTVIDKRVLVGYCSPGETTIRFDRIYTKKDGT